MPTCCWKSKRFASIVADWRLDAGSPSCKNGAASARSLSDLFHVCASLNLGAVQGAPLCRPTTSGLQRRNAPKVRLALRVVDRKARLRRCSSLNWTCQTALLAPCIRPFLATTHSRNKSDRLLGADLQVALSLCDEFRLRKSFEWIPCFFSSICRWERFMSTRLANSATVPPTS